MTEGLPAGDPPNVGRRRGADGDRRAFWRAVTGSVLRVGVVVGVLGTIYAVAPLGRRLNGSVAAELSASVVLLAAVTLWEFRNVSRSRFPEVRAIEAVGITLPLVLLPFAAAYWVMAHDAEASFGTHLSRLEALYFTITTFATVGYGDITAKSEPARAVVTAQMVLNLVLIGFIAKALVGTAQRRRDRLSSEPDDSRNAD
jgi:voltage-gated potassium channel